MKDIAIILILAVVLGLAVYAIIKARKRGSKCIGCPSGEGCSQCSGNCHKI